MHCQIYYFWDIQSSWIRGKSIWIQLPFWNQDHFDSDGRCIYHSLKWEHFCQKAQLSKLNNLTKYCCLHKNILRRFMFNGFGFCRDNVLNDMGKKKHAMILTSEDWQPWKVIELWSFAALQVMVLPSYLWDERYIRCSIGVVNSCLWIKCN